MKKGETVKVKKGITDPDTGLNIEGYIGRITEYIAKDLVSIEWDSISLQNLTDDFISSAIEDGCDYLTYNIGIKEVEPCAARDKPVDVLKAVKVLTDKWDDFEIFGEDAAFIEEVDEAGGWYIYLTDHLTFPFKAEAIERSGTVKAGTIINVHEIFDTDDLRGIIIKGKISRRTVYFPLCELMVTEKKDNANQHLVYLYREYFWNS